MTRPGVRSPSIRYLLRAFPLLMLPLVVAACGDGESPEPLAPEDHLGSAAAGSAHIGPVGSVEPVVAFDAAAGELPEGIAADRRGDLYVTLAPRAELIRIEPDGDWTVYAELASSLPAGAPGALGVAVDTRGRVFVALASLDPDTHGVHRVDRNGEMERLAGSEQIFFPNGVALDRHGALYVTDSALGAIWKIPAGGTAELWLQHPLLAGTGAFGLGVPIGANGIAVGRDVVYCVNSEMGLVIRVPVAEDGSAAAPDLLAGGAGALFGLDGLELDVHGRLYAVLNIQNRLIRIDPETGAVTDLAHDGLDFPAALAFGTARGQQKTLFVANFALVPTGATAGPGVVRVDVGVPGRPLP